MHSIVMVTSYTFSTYKKLFGLTDEKKRFLQLLAVCLCQLLYAFNNYGNIIPIFFQLVKICLD